MANTKNTAALDKAFEAIALEHFGVETLTSRNVDSLDFHEVSVVAMKRALLAAFKLGQASK